jgi:cytidine deaminase
VHSAQAPSDEERELYELAIKARDNAYVPYSHFPVGAALKAGSESFTGANFENASPGLQICAERTAVAQMIAAGTIGLVDEDLDPERVRVIELVAVTADAETISPCGACRQVLSEFIALDARIVYPRSRNLQSVLFSELLPDQTKI